MTDPKLMEYFKFDEADLFANRNGQFTEKQKTRLVEEDKSTKTWSAIGGGCLLLIALLGLVIAIVAGIANSRDIGFVIGFGLGFGCVWPLCWGGIGALIMSRAFQKFQVKLDRVEGPVNIIKAERTSTTTTNGHTHTSHYFVHELHIGGKEFDVESELADIMMQGDVYALYYTEGSEDDILSAELISKANYNAAVVVQVAPSDDPRVVELIRNGKIMDAVSLYRQNTNASLTEAQQVVDGIRNRLGL